MKRAMDDPAARFSSNIHCSDSESALRRTGTREPRWLLSRFCGVSLFPRNEAANNASGCTTDSGAWENWNLIDVADDNLIIHKNEASQPLAGYGSYDVHQITKCSIATPTCSTSSHSEERVNSRPTIVKCALHGLARSRICSSNHHLPASGLQPTTVFLDASASSDLHAMSSDTAYDSRSLYQCSELETPPLTPDTPNNEAFLSLIHDGMATDEDWDGLRRTRGEDGGDDDELYIKAHSLEIKEGKMPERPACFDTLIDDVPSSEHVQQFREVESLTPPIDKDEWFGLEYTLELSARERQPSEVQSLSAGEHSKSHESWAALHLGRIHPFLEDEDYYQWKNWHRYLDRQDERRKHKKGFEFSALSKDLAWFFADEMRTRDVMYWQKEIYGLIGDDVKERLAFIAEHRPDPYNPAMKHNLGWYLKRSRSFGCLRELHELALKTTQADQRENATEYENKVIDLDHYFDDED